MTKLPTHPGRVRAAIYARYSTDQQREASIDDQVRVCRDLARERGWQVLDEHIYKDQAVTGTARDRVGLSALQHAALRSTRPFDYVLIDDTSRLARDLAITLPAVRDLKFRGVNIYAVAQNIDSAREDAEDFFILHGMMDARFVRDLRHKTHRGLEGQALKGWATGGRAYGFKTVEVPGERVDAHGKPMVIGHEFKIDEAEADVVRRVFLLFADGAGLHTIALLLNEERVPHPRRGAKNDGGGWCHTTIRALLRNERYIGRFVWNKTRWERVPGSRKRRHLPRPESEWTVTVQPWLAIIDADLWARVQERIQHVEACYGERQRGRFVRPTNRAAATSRYILSGMLRCGPCGGTMVAVSGDKGRRDGRRYGCRRHASMGPTICGNSLTIKANDLDKLIADEVRSRLTAEGVEEVAAIFRAELAAAVKDVPDQIAEAEAMLARTEAAIANLIGAIEGGTDARSIQDRLVAQETNRAELCAKLDGLRAGPKAKDVVLHPAAVQGLIDNVTRALSLMDGAAGREALRHYLGTITMRPVEDNGVRTYLAEGAIDATEVLAEGLAGSRPGSWARAASPVSVVAGARFELATFGL